jgi:hypothetical protein
MEADFGIELGRDRNHHAGESLRHMAVPEVFAQDRTVLGLGLGVVAVKSAEHDGKLGNSSSRDGN